MLKTPKSPKPAGLRERKKADLKRRLAEETLALIRERGYDATTIDEVVRRCDVSQPTFYKYFTGKDAVLREHAMLGFGALLQEELARSEGTVVARMRRYLHAIAKQMTKERDLWYAIAISNAYNPIRNPELLHASDAGTRALEQVIQAAQAAGELTRELDAVHMASMLEGILFRVCIEWGARYPRGSSLAKSMDAGFAFFLRAAKT